MSQVDTTLTRAAINSQEAFEVPKDMASSVEYFVRNMNTVQLLLCDIVDELRRLNQLTYRRNPDDDIRGHGNT